MSTELIIFGFVFMAVCAGFVTLFLLAFHKKKYINALIFKGIASLCFIIFGAIICFNTQPTPSALIIFIGLCFGIVGDEVIALCQVIPKHDTLAFVAGGSCFLAGHVLYTISLLLVDRVNWILVVIFALLSIGLGGIYSKRKGFLEGRMKLPLTAYLGVVIIVTAVAVGLFAHRISLGAGLFALGGALFVVSDNILFAFKLGEKPFYLQNIALHIAYYLAQFSIAWSIAFL